ncbi:MAG: cobalamin B12-binding domain-containing protein [Planctomycetes bacterium]|nr:cobalamin B12-binding domain-containing protein [Planctomycetota bacterium]MCB9909039.1 cobalamin B12-binding domain-containing protein [Planctomycetota bacterium]MCB9911716.1 cobalamin B12-binding domain-containing protein [Planctomycetota bacterium]
MIQRKPKIVLFLPHRADPGRGEAFSADLLPLELLQIASGPIADGFEVVMIDAMIEPKYMDKVLEACDGAMLFGSSCILGYQVYDGYLVAKAVREKYPNLPIIWGGWFPSVIPEMYFEHDIADAVCIGQGEVAFRELVQAIHCGEDIAKVPGFAVQRDGQMIMTPHRPVVGFEDFAPVPWHLLEYDRYVELQLQPRRNEKVRHRFPLPGDYTPMNPPKGFSYFSSFGCPEPCTFCCSPDLTGRRWKAIPGKQLAEDIAELQQRFGFDMLRFQDANFGVAEKRTKEFCQTMVDLEVPVWWNGTIEIETIMRYKKETLDLLEESKCHLLWLGAESGTAEMQDRIKKHIKIENIPLAIGELVKRNIVPGTFWIIGFPGETQESMEHTLKQAAHTKFLYPLAGSDVYPFRPIPGTHDYREAIKLGYVPPKDFREWGDCFEYKYNSQNTPLPDSVRHTWQRYNNTAAIYDMHIQEGPLWMRRLLSKMAGARLKKGSYGFPIEQKLFDIYVKATGQGQKKHTDNSEEYQQLQPETHAQISGKPVA